MVTFLLWIMCHLIKWALNINDHMITAAIFSPTPWFLRTFSFQICIGKQTSPHHPPYSSRNCAMNLRKFSIVYSVWKFGSANTVSFDKTSEYNSVIVAPHIILICTTFYRHVYWIGIVSNPGLRKHLRIAEEFHQK